MRALSLLLAVLVLSLGALAAEPVRLLGPSPMPETVPAPPQAQPLTDDLRKVRAYPEQPPVIPHSIEGYQLSVNTNRCLSCHKREFTEGSGAPMISVTPPVRLSSHAVK